MVSVGMWETNWTLVL